jgi:hypothetical protein
LARTSRCAMVASSARNARAFPHAEAAHGFQALGYASILGQCRMATH